MALMNKTLLVLKNELITVLARRSFWLTALGIPLLASLLFAGVAAISKSAAASQAVSQALSSPQETLPEGYVDLSGVLQKIPPSVTPGTYVAFPDEAAARQALASGKISAFYLVAADYVKTGKVTYVRPDFNPLASGNNQSGVFTWMLSYNMAGANEMLANLVNGPLNLSDESLATTAAVSQTAPDQSNGLAVWTPYIISLLVFGLIIGASSLLLSNVSKEKENRVIEILLTTVTPRQLLTGKIIGLGVAGLVQAIVWLGTSYTLLRLSGRTFSLPSEINLPVSFLTWGVVFFLLGYAVYASLMAGLGALVPNLREASQATIVIMIPMMIPMMLSNTLFAQAPNGLPATILSLFPLSAPVAMMARISAGGVPFWQIPVAALLLAGTAVLIVRAVARMFRAQSLLSGQAFSVKMYFRALAGRG